MRLRAAQKPCRFRHGENADCILGFRTSPPVCFRLFPTDHARAITGEVALRRLPRRGGRGAIHDPRNRRVIGLFLTFNAYPARRSPDAPKHEIDAACHPYEHQHRHQRVVTLRGVNKRNTCHPRQRRDPDRARLVAGRLGRALAVVYPSHRPPSGFPPEVSASGAAIAPSVRNASPTAASATHHATLPAYQPKISVA